MEVVEPDFLWNNGNYMFISRGKFFWEIRPLGGPKVLDVMTYSRSKVSMRELGKRGTN